MLRIIVNEKGESLSESLSISESRKDNVFDTLHKCQRNDKNTTWTRVMHEAVKELKPKDANELAYIGYIAGGMAHAQHSGGLSELLAGLSL